MSNTFGGLEHFNQWYENGSPTQRNDMIESHALSVESLDIRQGTSIIEARKSRTLSDRVNLVLSLLLCIGIEDHGQNE